MAAQRRFDVLLTVDRGIAKHVTIPPRLAVVLVPSRSNRLRDFLPLLAKIRAELDAPQRGKLVILSP